MGSFEGYASTIGGILSAAEIPGFLTNYEEQFRRADVASEEWEAFVTSWWENFSYKPRTVTELADWMESQKLLESVVPAGRSPAGRRVSLGRKLQAQIDRIYNGITIYIHSLRNTMGSREYHVRKVRDDIPDPVLPPEKEALSEEALNVF